MRSGIIATALVLTSFLAGSAFAQEDQIIDVKPCNVLCKLSRNVSGNAQVSSSTSISNDYVPSDATPAAEEGSGLPPLSQITGSRMSIMVESPSERAAAKRQRAQLERETTVTSSQLDKAPKKAVPVQ